MKRLAVIIFCIILGSSISAQTNDVKVTGSGNQCRISWKVTGTIPGSFTIERRINGGGWTIIEDSYSMPAPYPGYKFAGINRNFYYVDNGLNSGATYEYRIDGTSGNIVTLRGVTYYVKNGGNNNADGLSDATAWATIERANRDRNPGDLVLFRRGDTFTSSGSVNLGGTGDGTSENPIKWSSYGTGDLPLLKINHYWGLQVRDIRHRHFEFLKFEGNLHNGHQSVFYIGCYNRDVYGIKILSCEFDLSNVVQGPMGGIFIWNDDGNHQQRHHNSDIEIAYSEIYGSQARSGIRSHDVQHHSHYHNNYVHDNGSQITCSGGANHIVEYNELKGGTYSNPANSGSKANSQAYNLKNMTYRRNLVYYCEDYGISLQDSEGGLVEYNTVYDRGETYGSFYAFSEYTPVNWTGNVVRGNIFVGSNPNNGAARIDVGDLGGNWRGVIDWDNNCLYETAGSIIKYNNPSSAIKTHTEWNSSWKPYHPNDVHANPQFMSIAGADFRLQSNSPATGKGYSANAEVVEVNNCPVLAHIGNPTIKEGTVSTIQLSSSDADGDAIRYSISPDFNFVSLTDNQNGTATLTFSPGTGLDETYRLTIVVSDANNCNDSQTITIFVEGEEGTLENSPPILAHIGDKSAIEGFVLNIPLSAGDPDGDPLRYSFTPDLDFMSLTDNLDGTGRLRIAPVAGDSGIYDLTVTVSEVVDGQSSPLEDSYIGSDDGYRSLGGNYSSFGQIFQASSGGNIKSCEFRLLRLGSPTGSIRAELFAISGTPGSSAIPVGSALATSITYNVTTVSGSGDWYRFEFDDNESYSLIQNTWYAIVVYHDNSDDINRIAFSNDLTAPAHTGNAVYNVKNDGWHSIIDTYDFNFRVYSDSGNGTATGASDSETFTLSVSSQQEVNYPPELYPIGDKHMNEGEMLSIPLRAYDENGDPLKFSISPDNIDFVYFYDIQNSVALLNIIPSFGDAGIYSLNVIVKDTHNKIDSETITIFVDELENGNTVPMLYHIDDQSVVAGETLVVELTARDADEDDISYSVTPALDFITLVDSLDGNGVLYFEPLEENKGKYDITVTITDINGSSDSKVFSLIVNDVEDVENSNVINSGALSPILGSMLMQEDKYYSGGQAYTYKNIPVANTENDELYLNLRYGSCNYEIPVNYRGLYTVKLHFAELTFRDGSIGSRVFNVDIENGQDRIENYDINLDVGPKTAAVKTFTDIEVTDGYISINLETVVQNALISGIEIINKTELTTGIDEKNLQNTFKVYPNPSSGVFSLELLSENSALHNRSYIIYDIAGKIIHESRINGSREVFDLTGNRRGMYIIKIGEYTEKIFLQ